MAVSATDWPGAAAAGSAVSVSAVGVAITAPVLPVLALEVLPPELPEPLLDVESPELVEPELALDVESPELVEPEPLLDVESPELVEPEPLLDVESPELVEPLEVEVADEEALDAEDALVTPLAPLPDVEPAVDFGPQPATHASKSDAPTEHGNALFISLPSNAVGLGEYHGDAVTAKAPM